MQNKSLFWKLSQGFALVFFIGMTCMYLFFRWQIDQMLGGNTDVVDSSQFQSISGKVAIINVNVLSRNAETMLPNQTVLVADNKIVAISETSTVPDDYHVIDGSDKFLIPGLIDSHVHLKKSRNDLLLYIANGITQVGEMTGMEHHFDWRQEIAEGTVGPDIFIASPKLNSQTHMNAKIRHIFEKRHQSYVTVEEAKEAVREMQQEGYQAIKISSDMASDIYYAVNEEAQSLGMPVIGHVPVGLLLNDVYAAGQSQLAHIDSIVQNLIQAFGGLWQDTAETFLDHIKVEAPLIAKEFKQNNISLASTVWLHQSRPSQDFDLAGFLKSIPYQYQNPGWVEGSVVSRGCLPGENSYDRYHADKASEEAWDVYYQTYNEAIKIVTQALIGEGVTITAGTDALGACGMIPGFSLHQELIALHKIGMTNPQILFSATTESAKWMGVNSGQIAVGSRADLVLLGKNPLLDIENTQSILGVMANGQYYDRGQLDLMLSEVEAANARSRTIDITAYLN